MKYHGKQTISKISPSPVPLGTKNYRELANSKNNEI